ncbi:MAG: RNA polymerase sigma factor [bacterium]
MSVRIKTDEQLMLEYSSGNPKAFEELFRRYGTRIYNLFLRWERNAEAAQDLLQDCFVRVIEARDRYQPTKAFSNWLYTIAMNLLRDRQRQRGRRKVRQFNENEAEFLNIPDTDSRNRPDRVADRSSLKESVEEALHALPEDQKEAIMLSKYQGLSFLEIGQVLGISTEAAKQKAYRGMLTLRKSLAHLLEELKS